MELRKNPRLDIHSKSNLFFNLALVFILAVMNLAFEWKVYDTPNVIDAFEIEMPTNRSVPQEASPTAPQPIEIEEIVKEAPAASPQKTKNVEDDEEIMIQVKLDVALEGSGFDNSFLDKMAQS